jgi:DNA-binding LacI/PurR family transcriptional regulator
MSMLIELMRGTDIPARKRILLTQLVVRGSTARCPGKVRAA